MLLWISTELSQKDKLLDALAKFEDMTGSNAELIDELGFKPASVRRLTGTLTKLDVLERVDRGVYKLNRMFRHFISALFYCSDEIKTYSAKTFKTNKRSVFTDLKEALLDETEDICSEAKEEEDSETPAVGKSGFGYAVDEVEGSDIDTDFIHPEIEVIEE